MCIILGEVRSVAKTKIFVLPNKDKTRQMTFYSNVVDTTNPNMMILPVPTGGADAIELHTVKYKRLFDDLKESVESLYKEPVHNPYMRSYALSASIPRHTLEIFDHGSYRVSIAPQLEDLLRLDMRVFKLTPELYQFFGKNYNREFSFLCCILKPGSFEYEPLCYSHPLHSSGKLFVPTMHYHVHGSRIETESADWDHFIYSTNTTAKANRGYESKYYNQVKWSHLPEDFQKMNYTSVRCAEIKGHQKNHDLGFEMW